MRRPIFRSIALLLAVSFLSEPCAFAAEELRPARFDLNGSVALEHAKQTLSYLPASVARIEAAHEAPSATRKIYLVHDAHTNVSSQLNVARTLDLLFAHDAGRTLGEVFLEAGAGDESLSFLRSPLSPDERERVAGAYLRRGLLQGVEYADITQDHPFALRGVEDMSLYAEAVETYRRLAAKSAAENEPGETTTSAVSRMRPPLSQVSRARST